MLPMATSSSSGSDGDLLCSDGCSSEAPGEAMADSHEVADEALLFGSDSDAASQQGEGPGAPAGDGCVADSGSDIIVTGGSDVSRGSTPSSSSSGLPLGGPV